MNPEEIIKLVKQKEAIKNKRIELLKEENQLLSE